MIRHALFLILLLASQKLVAVHYLSLAQQMGLVGQTGWLANPESAPPGVSYRSTSGASSRSGTISMPVPVPPGTWRVLLKLVGANNATPPTLPANRITITMPAGSTPSGDIAFLPDDRNTDGLWTEFGTVTLAANLSTFTLKMDRTDGSVLTTGAANPGVMAICFTSNMTGFVTGDDYLQTWDLSTSEDTGTPFPGNYVKNASFEAGITEVSFADGASKWTDTGDMWSTEEAHSGTHSLKISTRNCTGQDSQWSLQIITRPYLVRPDRKHSARVWVKPVGGTGGTMKLSIIPVEHIPEDSNNNPIPGFTPIPLHETGNIAITGGWQEIKLEGRILRAYPPPAQFGLKLAFTGSGGGVITAIYVDDIQLSEGATITPFVPARANEIQIANTKLGGRYYIEDSDCRLQFRFANNTSGTGVQGGTYKVWGPHLEELNSGVMFASTASAGNDVTTGTIDLSLMNTLGPHRIRAEYFDSVTEMYFSRLHKPRMPPADQARIGGHLENWWYSAELADGIQWTRLLSPNAAVDRWKEIEKSEGVFTWYDWLMMRTVGGKNAFGVLQSAHALWADRHYFEYTVTSGTFVVGETVTQTGVAASGIVTYVFTGAHVNGPSLQLKSVTGSFQQGSIITGGTSGAIGQLSTAATIKTPDYPGYTNFVGKLVERYRPWITIWELDNEPHLNGEIPKYTAGGGLPTGGAPGTNYRFYGQMCRAVMELMAGGCPECKIVGIGGVPDDVQLQYIWDDIEPSVRSQFWGVSMHLYSASGEAIGSFNNTVTRTESAKMFLAAQSPPMLNVWNTESGSATFSQFYGNLANWRNHGEALMPYRDTEDQIRSWARAPYWSAINLINSMSAGFSRHWLYDTRHGRWYSDSRASFSGGSNTDQDMQECLHPAGAAFRHYAWVLDSPSLATIGVIPKVVNLQPHTRCYGFSSAGDGTWDVLLLHGVSQHEWRQFTWSGVSLSDYDVFDMYGNAIPQTSLTLKYGAEPIMIKARSPLTLGTMAAAYQAASFATSPDVTAPNLVIVGYPPADAATSLENHTVRLRWIAWDNVDFLASDNVLGMSFRWRLVPSATFATFSPWTQNSFVEIPAALMTAGVNTLTVEAQDSAGNITPKSVTFNYTPP